MRFVSFLLPWDDLLEGGVVDLVELRCVFVRDGDRTGEVSVLMNERVVEDR